VKRLLALLLLLAATAAAAEVMPGVVIVVIDGDTVLFRPDHYAPAVRAFLKVRLAAIDAPEAAQPHGDIATRALKAHALDQRATLDIIATDVYGRKLGWLVVGGVPVNVELVRQGHAWAASRGRDNALHALQQDAQRRRIGLWQAPDPVPPWVWRRMPSPEQ
jgi:endonuclease YncB( thermonuclease family)